MKIGVPNITAGDRLKTCPVLTVVVTPRNSRL